MTTIAGPASLPAPPPSLRERALADLRFVRETMERAATFTAFPGLGALLMGSVALVAAVASARAATPRGWLGTWLVAAAVAFPAGLATMAAKARRLGTSLSSGPARRFALGFGPPVVSGAILTVALAGAGRIDLLPGTWLLLYGAGVVAGSSGSPVRAVPAFGVLLMLCGSAAFAAPASWGTPLLALGFGGLQAAAGLLVARRHGG